MLKINFSLVLFFFYFNRSIVRHDGSLKFHQIVLPNRNNCSDFFLTFVSQDIFVNYF